MGLRLNDRLQCVCVTLDDYSHRQLCQCGAICQLSQHCVHLHYFMPDVYGIRFSTYIIDGVVRWHIRMH